MPTRTVSITGGNFNATSSWTGGVVPLTTDDIIADATSGNLTVNVNSTINGFDFTNWLGTLQLTANLSSAGAGTCSFGASMSITGAGYINSSSYQSSKRIKSNGLTIPRLVLATNVHTLLDNFTIDELLLPTNNSGCTTTGFNIYVRKLTVTSSVASGFNNSLVDGTTQFIFNHPSGAIWDCPYAYTQFNKTIQFNTPGYITFSSNSYMLIQPSATATYSLIQGTISGDPNLIIIPTSATIRYRYELGNNTEWNNVRIMEYGGATFACDLINDLRFKNLGTCVNAWGSNQYYGPIANSRFSFRFYGNKSLIGGSVNLAPSNQILSSTNTLPQWYGQSFELWLPSGQTHSFTELNTFGLPQNRGLIRAATASSPTYISVSSTQSIVYTTFRDVYSSNAIYTFGGSTSNTQNIFVANTMVPNSSNIFIE